MRGEIKSTGRNSQYKSLHSDHVGPLFLIKTTGSGWESSPTAAQQRSLYSLMRMKIM